ncbi:N-acetyltransferase family protein [Dankookia rubra]|uniref:N-acetyltransferase family protein n=1 Tax=Dankookia rubra TaxID=1442381 RepID=A0A4R5QFW6_9PROT|nr:GNAT family N-acetyltransferase [Dankookia rubra]TDH61936.1 N-acetyltransferase family protein [Dankookia rubra]
MTVRAAGETDPPGILAIYNEVIRTSTAVQADDPMPPADRAAWFAGRQAEGYPVLVAEDAAGMAGFGDFRAWPGHRHTVAHSLDIRAKCRGRGGALVTALFPVAEGLGKHMMIAGVDAAKAASIAMHERLGFGRVAHLREVGRKFDRWLDLVFLQRLLGAPQSLRNPQKQLGVRGNTFPRPGFLAS